MVNGFLVRLRLPVPREANLGPPTSDLGLLIDIVPPWKLEDARRVFGDRMRPYIPIREEASPCTRSSSSMTMHSTGRFGDARGKPCARDELGRLSGRAGLGGSAPFVRPDGVRSERVGKLLRTHRRLRIQTQDDRTANYDPFADEQAPPATCRLP